MLVVGGKEGFLRIFLVSGFLTRVNGSTRLPILGLNTVALPVANPF